MTQRMECEHEWRFRKVFTGRSDQTANQISHQGLNHIDAAFPTLGVAGFLPGLTLGLVKG
jgi:hypothetical protein